MENSEVLEVIYYIIFSIFSAIAGVVIAAINRKRIRNRMNIIDYNEQKLKRKGNYTRNTILNDQIVSKIKENDKEFDENEFKEWAQETFIEFYKSWTNKDMSKVRNRLDYNLYEQYKLLLNTNVGENSTNFIQIEKVNYIDLSAYSEDNEKEIIEAAINVIIQDYTIDDKTNKVISGSKTIKERTTYIMKFYRKMGSKTEGELKKNSCPNCGAILQIEENKCKYCNTLIFNKANQWILNSIDKY